MIMKKIFEQLKGLSCEEGAKLVRENFNVEEQSFSENGVIDFNFYVKDKEDTCFTYTTTYEYLEDDEIDIDWESGYWSLMIEAEYYTHYWSLMIEAEHYTHV
jgi:hypothetical protein